ncbi:hypothetical protein [Burkholderia sp. S-53]|uniref:hypothetical protein n=1 Tax=Burkholderia sp. S-53 TaxID=2906514 RepID=UPI0021D196BC|nr:hypothetical protein [Burkholderia sp. S-53]UXU89341.1 hypothetical protein LXM88_13065 [Burkholderia sp. S-53]
MQLTDAARTAPVQREHDDGGRVSMHAFATFSHFRSTSRSWSVRDARQAVDTRGNSRGN